MEDLKCNQKNWQSVRCGRVHCGKSTFQFKSYQSSGATLDYVPRAQTASFRAAS